METVMLFDFFRFSKNVFQMNIVFFGNNASHPAIVDTKIDRLSIWDESLEDQNFK